MDYKAQGPFPEECRVAINRVASYELHVSDAYLSMACYYDEEIGMPSFVTFFKEQAEVKREHAKQFLRYLRKREGIICLPTIKRPDIDNWGSGRQALESALQLENELSKVLQDLKISASENSERDLFDFVEKFLDEQIRNIGYLEYHLVHEKKLEELAQQEDLYEKPATTSGEEA